MIRIYNSHSQTKEVLQPRSDGRVKIYVCGMTVYDFCHLGHARVLVSFDMVTRYLRHLGYEVVYVRNITDIDDKIIQAAQHEGVPYTTITKRYIQAMAEDERALNILPPSQQPRATEFIPEIIALIERLIEKGYAYVGERGDVYYDIRQFPRYGALSKKDLSRLESGARVQIDKAKQHPFDFVLWKRAKPSEPRWDSPWGTGRPGWHIECSAMAMACLGENIDIHGGGFDLLFPHHENEIAQSEAACDCTYVNLWMHVGFLQINAEKMSKSLGNFFTIREVLNHYPAEVLRFFLLSSHYRSQLNYSEESLNNAKAGLSRLYIACRDVQQSTVIDDKGLVDQFHTAMQDDFNTPEALAVLFTIANKINLLKESHPLKAAGYVGLLRQLGGILGLLQQTTEAFFNDGLDSAKLAEIQELVSRRNRAREIKNWEDADRIRQQLLAMGIEIEDTASGTRWRNL